MWDLKQQQLVKQFRRKQERFCLASICGRKSQYIVSAEQNDLAVWDRDSTQCILVQGAHQKRICGFVVHPHDPCQLVSFSQDSTISVWRIRDADQDTDLMSELGACRDIVV
jgi:WD40 repeat protein